MYYVFLEKDGIPFSEEIDFDTKREARAYAEDLMESLSVRIVNEKDEDI